MRRTLKRFKRYGVYVLVRAVVSVCGLLPTAWVLAFGRFIGRVIEQLASRARPRAQQQVQQCLQLNSEQSKRLVTDIFRHFGCLAAEIAIMPRLLNEPERIRWSPGSQEVLTEAMAGGRGAVFVSAHLGNWELLAHAISRAGFRSVTVARRSTNPRVGDWLEARRHRSQLTTIRRRDPRAVRRILRALRDNCLVGVLIDQHTRVDSVAVPFFGRPAATPSIAASLAVRGTPLLLGTTYRDAEDKHVLVVRRIPYEPSAKGRRERIKELSAELTHRIEEAIRQHPAQWTWFHERWQVDRLQD